MIESAPQRAFAVHKAAHTIEAFVSNLPKLAELLTVARVERRSGTAVVVGAGPSLGTQLERIRSMAENGHAIFAVNTAASALDDSGIRIDYLVARESLDVSGHLELEHPPMRAYLLDVQAHPRCFQVAADRARWFVPASLQMLDAAERMGVRPVFAGPSALTSAVALAEHMGAARIVLAGVDLAFAPDGRGYGEGTRFESMAMDGVDGDVARLVGRDAQAELARMSGQRMPLERETVADVELVDGAAGKSLLTWTDQIQWLETFAERYAGIVETQRMASTTGAKISGWGGVTLAFDRFDDSCAEVDIYKHAAYVLDVYEQCKRARAIAGAALVGDVSRCPELIAGCELVETHAAGGLIGVRESGERNPASMIRAAYGVIRASADKLEALLG